MDRVVKALRLLIAGMELCRPDEDAVCRATRKPEKSPTDGTVTQRRL
jgi:hypothetical protein